MSTERREQNRELMSEWQDQPRFNASGIYTMAEAASILHVNCSYLYELTHLKDDPFPARILFWKKQGLFVLQDELFDWVKRNAPLRDERKKFRRGQSSGIE
ncbi:hypothetical protein [Adlercreutzia sp. ZJ141]|uniref:hypothetical protein n=1 Tax=Adlercreutzia sp. ZJ141 TaxID=2709406 RepID=UPI0013EC5FA7|nr:hypothetical protein [Adlercreutzia sp. ZJ141]